LTGFTLKSADVENVDKVSEPLLLRYSFEANSYIRHAGNLLLLRPRVLGEKWTDTLEETKPRKYPMVFDGKTAQTDRYEITLPANVSVDELPEPVKLDCGYVSYESSVEMKGPVMVYTRAYMVNKVNVPLDDMPKVKKFFREVLADEQSSAVLKKSGLQ
jgi:hypothetical protein